MPVDMHEFKFVLRLEELPPFERGEPEDAEVAALGFPAWRALFTSLLLWGHSTGYRLPSYDRFLDYCRKAYSFGEGGRRFARWFEPPLVQRTDRRIRGFYESGMAEAHLYACLVDVFEDRLRDGLVFYDPRIDWKIKWDAAVVTRGERFAIDSAWGQPGGRRRTEARRDKVERGRKERTAVSSHWDNAERERWTPLQIFRSEGNCQNVNGVRLFSMSAVNELLTRMYDLADYRDEERFFFPTDREGRRRLYRSMLKGGDA